MRDGKHDGSGINSRGPISGQDTLRIDCLGDCIHHVLPLGPSCPVNPKPDIGTECLNKAYEQCLEYGPDQFEGSGHHGLVTEFQCGRHFFLKNSIVANLSENNARSEMDWSRILTDCKPGQDEDNSARRYGGVANFVIGVRVHSSGQ